MSEPPVDILIFVISQREGSTTKGGPRLYSSPAPPGLECGEGVVRALGRRGNAPPRPSATPSSPVHLGLRAPALLPLPAAGQVAPPLLAGRPFAVDVVVVQEVSGAAAELPLRAVDFAGARRLQREARLSQKPLHYPPRDLHPTPYLGEASGNPVVRPKEVPARLGRP